MFIKKYWGPNNMTSSTKIPFYKRTYTESEIEAVVNCIKGGQLTQGALVAKFEEEFAKYNGAKYAVAVNSCTSGIFLALMLLKPKKVSIPSMTFASMASGIVHSGAKLGWIDGSWSGSKYAFITDNMNKGVIYDAAHAGHRGEYTGKPNDLMVYSFYPTKLISSTEGGMITTNNKEYAEWLKKARWHARVGKTWDYEIEFPAWKFNMTDIQAALGLDYLNRIDGEVKQRRILLNLYNDFLGTTIKSDHIFQIIISKRDEFVKFMADSGIECSMHFKPVHKQPAFKKFYVKLPRTEHFEKLIVSLPLFPSMSEMEVEKVCTLVQKWKDKNPLSEDEYITFEEFLRS
jgi:dTDP-4-amino-4,6-dideoxygalactose transaminase